MRHLADASGGAPHWRQHRPAVMVEAAEFRPGQQQDGGSGGGGEGGATGTLLLRGYVRGLGLSANQAVHVPGAGDFQLSQIEGPPEPAPANDAAAGGAGAGRGQQHAAAQRAQQQQQQQQSGGGGGGGGGGMDTDVQLDAASGLPVLARPDPAAQEPLVRENDFDPLAGEQTWPTEEVRGSWRWLLLGDGRWATSAGAAVLQRNWAERCDGRLHGRWPSLAPAQLITAHHSSSCRLTHVPKSKPGPAGAGGGGGARAQAAQAAPAARHLRLPGRLDPGRQVGGWLGMARCCRMGR